MADENKMSNERECPKCGWEIDHEYSRCLHCGARLNKKWYHKNWITKEKIEVIVALLFIIGFLYIVGSFFINTSPESNTQQKETVDNWKNEVDKIAAYVMVQDFVKDRLKAPSTADFPGAFEGYEVESFVSYSGNQIYSIRAWVDSENSFGAKLRINFQAEIQQTGKDEWRLKNLNLQN
jgi:hypothetical protein